MKKNLSNDNMLIKTLTLKYFSHRVTRNYTVCRGSFVFHEDIIKHAQCDNENIITSASDNITAHVVLRAVREVFGDSIQKSSKRVNGKLKKNFMSLKKCDVAKNKAFVNLDDEWNTIRENFESDVKDVGGGNWNVVHHQEFSPSCARFNNERCDGKVGLIEVVLRKNVIDMKIEIFLKYDERVLPLQEKLIQNLNECGISKSRVCWGFLAEQDLHFDDKTCKRHIITHGDISETRYFSGDCEIFTNSGGMICSNCQRTKITIRKPCKRRKLKPGLIHPNTNNRYMSKVQLVTKAKNVQNQKREEKLKRQRIEEQLLKLEEARGSYGS